MVLQMCISIKTSNDISKMRISGKLAAEVLEIIKPYVKAGISTGEIDFLCNQHITKNQNAISASLGYYGFPKSVCISVNDVVCHGIPSYKKILKNGDIVNIDVAIIKNGFYSDTSKMFIVGKSTIIAEKLCKITQESLYTAILMIKPYIKLREIGKSIQNFVEPHNFSIVKEYCGHGIGRNLHENPQVLHYDSDNNNDVLLKPGMVFTIEPMVNEGSSNIKIVKDGWTIKTKDKTLSAQYEHTILVTENGCEIMTLRSDETISRIIKF